MLISVSKVYNRKADFSYIALFFYYCKRKKRGSGFFFEFLAKESENKQFYGYFWYLAYSAGLLPSVIGCCHE